LRLFLHRVRVCKVVLFAAFILGFSTAEASPQSPDLFFGGDSKVTVTYYLIEGRSISELREAIRKNGPKDSNGVSRYASTDWYIRWNIKPTKDSAVNPDLLTVDYQANVLLPLVTNIDALSPEDTKYWNSFFHALLVHERGHIDICRTRYREVADAIKLAVKQNPRCSPEEAEKVAQRQVALIHADDLIYDQDTKHGMTQGVTLIRKSE